MTIPQFSKNQMNHPSSFTQYYILQIYPKSLNESFINELENMTCTAFISAEFKQAPADWLLQNVAGLKPPLNKRSVTPCQANRRQGTVGHMPSQTLFLYQEMLPATSLILYGPTVKLRKTLWEREGSLHRTWGDSNY